MPRVFRPPAGTGPRPTAVWDFRKPYQASPDAPTYGRIAMACKDTRHAQCRGECDCFCHDKDGP